MDANTKNVLNDIRKGKYAPVYFLQGDESYYIDLISDYIEEHALTESEKSFNQVIVYGKDATMATILTHARRFPMMAERQVVIVKEAQEIQDLNKEMGAKLLLDYLANQVPSTVLVFGHKHKTLDKRRELGKKIDKLAVVVNAKRVYENQLPEFVADYTAERNVAIEERAVQALCEFVGNDLHRLSNEIDKLIISLQPGEVISLDQVMTQVGVSKEYNIFELQRAVLKGDVVLANKIVNYFESNTRKNPIIPVVAFLYAFFSKLLMATQIQDKSEKSIASELKVSPYAVRDYSLALRRYRQPQIIGIVSSLKDADLKLKGVNTGTISEGEIFRELIWRLMNVSAD